MKEIIYLQAGKLANYTGTHFWNAQESYLQSEEPYTAPDISFCESIDSQNISTLCPRLITFDHKSNFGALGSLNTLGGEDIEIESLSNTWNGELVEYKQDRISKSAFQSSLEEDEDKNQSSDLVLIQDFRYWSDYSRVYYLPRTLQKIPDPPEWETTNVDLNHGLEVFTRLNEETELMDGTLRLFVEDCDNIQGVQLINDTDTFGSFMGTFFTHFRDEYPKLPSFSFPILSGATSDYDAPTSLYHQSAILSAHVETCTLPFRLPHNHYDIPSVSGHLNYRGTSPFSELSGSFPRVDFTRDIANFSSEESVKSPYCRWDVTRGLTPKQIGEYDTWSTQNLCVKSSVHAHALPLPNSFPIFNASESPKSKKNSEVAEVYSSLSASSNSSKMFRKYAMFIDECGKRRTTTTASIDIPVDDLRELANDLWTMHDNASEETEALAISD
uniref:Tubulin nucleotide-binding domain-like protein n=1 Tax=Psilocybe cubensis TaxID=181762 RepID=A0A8H7XJ48_PSICU